MTGGKQSVRGRRDMQSGAPGSIMSVSDEDFGSRLSAEERDCLNAKMYLMNQPKLEEPCLYEHLTKLIVTLMDNPKDASTFSLEDISSFIQREHIHIPTMPLRDDVPKTHTENLASAQWNLFKKKRKPPKQQFQQPVIHHGDDEDDDHVMPDPVVKVRDIPNLMRQAAMFELAGVGLPREDIVKIALSLMDLLDTYPTIQNIRFWGKMYGTLKSYYVAETEFGDNDYEDDVSDDGMIADQDDDLESGMREEDSSLFDDVILPEDLKPMYKDPPKIPCEPAGSGLNKKVYFVTSEPGLPWIRLPHVTPAQIQAARKIRKYFTGDLHAQVVSYPPFPGVEKNYLRAQIARISSCTQISPIGYFRFDDEGGEEEEGEEEVGGGRSNIVHDTEFEGLNVKDLADGGLQTWCHHTPAILQQGRTSWWNPVQTRGEEFAEEDEEGEDAEEERNEPDEPEPEVGPPLLTPIAEDENVDNSPPWIAATSSKFLPEYSVAILQSNVWIGAFAFAAERGKFFENIYLGWGVKNLEHDFEPALPEDPLAEFPSGPEITEADDPTPEEEAAIRAAEQEKNLEAEIEKGQQEDEDEGDDEGGGEEEEEEEEEEE